ncbi:class I SAM-dependent methyltransferase [Thermodesulfobacteriota bacterium]
MKKTNIEILRERKEIWRSKEVIRRLYIKWYHIISNALKPGNILELGGGSGNLQEFFSHAITSDILFAPWLDAVLDAEHLPFKAESLDNIVLFDVLHHLTNPINFFIEARRILRSGGKIILMEPYISWASFFVYRFLHAEDVTWHIEPFKTNRTQKNDQPFHGNQAIPTLLFEKYSERFTKEFPEFKIIKTEKMDFIIYPLSGGFHNPSLIPLPLYSSLEKVEILLRPFNHILAFRFIIVLEKQPKEKE